MSGTIFKAFCIECGAEIPRESIKSHMLCPRHYTQEKAMHDEQRIKNHCNICGGRMEPGAVHLAHGNCLMVWIHDAQTSTSVLAHTSVGKGIH